MSDSSFAIILATSSLVIAAIALALAILGFRRAAEQEKAEASAAKLREEKAEAVSETERILVRRAKALAEAAVILRAEALMLFDQQGLVIETYNMAEEQGVRTAASLAELISILKKLGFPTETLIFRNGKTSMIIELRRLGDVTPYCLIIGGSAPLKNAKHAHEVLQKYVESVVERR